MAFGVTPSESFVLRSSASTRRSVLGIGLAAKNTTHQLQVYRYGDFDPRKETFIVVMGRGQSAAYAELWVRENTSRYNIFVYDQPYQGRSTPTKTTPADGRRYGDIEDFAHYPQHLDNVVNEVTARMRAAGVDSTRCKPHVFGHSLGGWTVKRYNQMERYRDKVATVHTTAMMARVEVRPKLIRELLGENRQLWTGAALAINLVDGLVRGFDAPSRDPDRRFEARLAKPYAQTTAAVHTAEVLAEEAADYSLQTNEATIRWANQAMLAAVGLHLPWRRSFAPELHIIPSHDIIADPTFMRVAARSARHGAYVAVEGMLHDGLMWPERVVRAYSAMQQAFVADPSAMQGEQRLGDAPRCDPTDRAPLSERLVAFVPSIINHASRTRYDEAIALQAESKRRYETGEKP